MRINEFIKENHLKQTDALVLRKRFFGMVDHYVLFMGYRANKPLFVANYKDGVQEVTTSEINKYLQVLEPQTIERFSGSDNERTIAFRRALSRVGEKAYNYFGNNCEHFKNWVHHGENFSSQVKIAGNTAIVAGVGLGAIGLVKKYPKTALLGAGILLVGALLKDLSSDE
ncbi:lecithin retinol acyltransferase family protein [Tenacibaculum ovolyticum]|uniref:lecithin retinol acyltransferase family protein n=1 Tax=Tenacibaculum ovolyticum TaxID=104270 RepID=UPI0022F3EC6F|nr:lecithin retinol acyltransferase family protein [Tenacibaculum ovolyticum]WBX76239.1 lecithin retinol acyltransferase family protein [Tenacibaculum ovolyticum]